jgi:hypothetical protein
LEEEKCSVAFTVGEKISKLKKSYLGLVGVTAV